MASTTCPLAPPGAGGAAVEVEQQAVGAGAAAPQPGARRQVGDQRGAGHRVRQHPGHPGIGDPGQPPHGHGVARRQAGVLRQPRTHEHRWDSAGLCVFPAVSALPGGDHRRLGA